MRPFIAIQDNAVLAAVGAQFASSNAAMRNVSRELREVLSKRAANFAGKELVHRRNRATRLIQGHALDAIHRKKNRWQSDALAVRLVELPNKMVEGIQINPAQRNARRID